MNTIQITLVDAIKSLRPNAEWSLINNDYANIEWFSENETKPSIEEINTEIIRLQAELDSLEYQRLRAAEYPDFRLYLDGVVKGDQAQIQDYIDQCLAVKEKYPKPSNNI